MEIISVHKLETEHMKKPILRLVENQQNLLLHVS